MIKKPVYVLTERQRDVLALIAQGLIARQIGERLGISQKTVDKHRTNALAKTGCLSSAHLVWWAVRNGELACIPD